MPYGTTHTNNRKISSHFHTWLKWDRPALAERIAQSAATSGDGPAFRTLGTAALTCSAATPRRQPQPHGSAMTARRPCPGLHRRHTTMPSASTYGGCGLKRDRSAMAGQVTGMQPAWLRSIWKGRAP